MFKPKNIQDELVDIMITKDYELLKGRDFLFFCVVVVQSLSHVPLFCDPMDCSPPGSFVHGISQARILEWAAISFSRGSSGLRDRIHVSCISRQILYHQGSHQGNPVLW